MKHSFADLDRVLIGGAQKCVNWTSYNLGISRSTQLALFVTTNLAFSSYVLSLQLYTYIEPLVKIVAVLDITHLCLKIITLFILEQEDDEESDNSEDKQGHRISALKTVSFGTLSFTAFSSFVSAEMSQGTLLLLTLLLINLCLNYMLCTEEPPPNDEAMEGGAA